MRDLTLDQFSAELFSKSPVPGGGGVAAFTGSLAVSLGAMATNLTVGKKKYEEYNDELEEILVRADRLRKQLLDLIDEDAKVYYEVSRAYKISPRDESEIEKALERAAQPPLMMMREIIEVINMLDGLSEKTSRLLISDIGVGATLAGAALNSAYLNVLANTRLMKDRDKAEATEKVAGELSVYTKTADEIYKKVLIFFTS